MSLIQDLPSGSIIVWSGAIVSIPSGWELCDGSGSTPDLRDRFIVGAGSSYSVNSFGGQETISTVPQHNHAFTVNSVSNTGAHSHPAVNTSNAGAHNHNDDNAGNHSHNFDFAGYHSHNHTMHNRRGVNTGNSSIRGSRNQETSYAGAHSHNVSNAGNHNHNWNSNGAHNHNVGIGNSGDHTHNFSITTSEVGQSSVSVLPSYYALCYIKKS